MAEDTSKDITYNSALEKLIAEEAERCSGLSWLHNKAEAYYSIRNSWIALPTIILSTTVGFLSGTSTSIFSNPMTASVGIGAVSLFTGVISTIGTFYGFAKRTEAHRIASIQYSKLGRFLSIELTLPKSERIAAKDVLKITKDSIERLLETSPAVPDNIIKEYKEIFKEYTDVAHPDVTNGLRKVFIYSKEVASPTVEETPIKIHIRS
jgi:hypothetical protein